MSNHPGSHAARLVGWLTALGLLMAAAPAFAQPIDEGPIDEGPIDEGPLDEEPTDAGPVEEDPAEDPPTEDTGLVPPRLKTFVEAPYPPRAAEEGVEAVVTLMIDIDASGRVSQVELIEPAPPSGYGFAEAAIEAVQRFEFEPATEAGVPVPVRLSYRYRFELAEEEPQEIAAPEGADAAAGAFQGRALERGTRDPLVGVIVTIFKDSGEEAPIGFEAATDAEGFFEFTALEPGTWKVLIEPDGYFPVRTTEAIGENELTEVVYFVEKGSYNPFDVLVEGARLRKEVTKRTLTAQEIEKVPGTFGDPLTAVLNLPGLARPDSFSGEFIVRGSASRDTQLFVQSMGVPIIYHFGGLRSVIPLGMIGSIDFYPGNFSAYYGRAIGGVLDVNLKELNPDRWHGYLDTNFFDTGIFLEAPITEDLAVAVAIRRSYIDFLIEAVVPDDAGVNVLAAPAYHDWQALVDWRPSLDHKVKLFVFGSSDEFKLLFDDPAEDIDAQNGDLNLSIKTLRGIFEYEWSPTPRLTSTTRIATGTDQLRFDAFGLFTFNLDLYQPNLRETITYRVTDSTTVRAGMDVVWGKLDLTVDAPPDNGSLDGGSDDEIDADAENIFIQRNDLRSRDVGAFVELELKLTDDLLFIPGARVDYYEIIGDVTFDPRLTVRYDVAPEWTLKGGIGLFHQSPGADLTIEGFGNPELGPEAAFHYALGVEWTPLDHLLLDTTVFYKDMFDLVSPSDDVVERDGELVSEVYNNGGRGRVYGLEVLARHEFANGFFGWISYTLSRAERLDYGEDAWRLFDFEQTHILTLIGSYRLPKNWELGLRWRYVTGNPATLPDGGVFNVDSGEYEPIQGARNATRQPAFHQLDLRLDKRWIYDTWNLNAYFDIQNLYNRSNAEGYSYNFDYSERRITQSLPILPIIGVKAEF